VLVTPSAVIVDQANHTAYVVNAASNNVSMINTHQHRPGPGRPQNAG